MRKNPILSSILKKNLLHNLCCYGKISRCLLRPKKRNSSAELFRQVGNLTIVGRNHYFAKTTCIERRDDRILKYGLPKKTLDIFSLDPLTAPSRRNNCNCGFQHTPPKLPDHYKTSPHWHTALRGKLVTLSRSRFICGISHHFGYAFTGCNLLKLQG